MLNWLSDFLQPICSPNKHLQQSSFQLARLKDEINDALKVIESDYILFEKPLLMLKDLSTKSCSTI